MSNRISVRVPATSANLGCLFDCAALALSLYLDIHVSPRHDSAVRVGYRGVSPERIPTDETNLVAQTILTTLESWNRKRGFDLEIENQIPVGVGLGSSAAAIVGALAACHWLADNPLYDEELVSMAATMEGHPDNVAAAWHGGFTVAVEEGGRVLAYSCPVPEPLKIVLVVPDYVLPTPKARSVLPESFPRADAIHNLQRAAVISAQLFSGKPDLHPCFFDDRWHQPYRTSLVPGLSEVLNLKHSDLVGVCLSGAGPSILGFSRGNAITAGEAIRGVLETHEVRSEIYILDADNRGAKGWSLPG